MIQKYVGAFIIVVFRSAAYLSIAESLPRRRDVMAVNKSQSGDWVDILIQSILHHHRVHLTVCLQVSQYIVPCIENSRTLLLEVKTCHAAHFVTCSQTRSHSAGSSGTSPIPANLYPGTGGIEITQAAIPESPPTGRESSRSHSSPPT